MDERVDPFQQLQRSHRRLEERLDDLLMIAERAEGGAVDTDAVRDVAAFFARAVRRHEEDEERSLFPRLAHRPELAPVLAKLAAEHREHETLHARLEKFLTEADPSSVAAARELAAIADALCNAYRTHITEEERSLFPAARRALDETSLASMMDEMQSRRGR